MIFAISAQRVPLGLTARTMAMGIISVSFPSADAKYSSTALCLGKERSSKRARRGQKLADDLLSAPLKVDPRTMMQKNTTRRNTAQKNGNQRQRQQQQQQQQRHHGAASSKLPTVAPVPAPTRTFSFPGAAAIEKFRALRSLVKSDTKFTENMLENVQHIQSLPTTEAQQLYIANLCSDCSARSEFLSKMNAINTRGAIVEKMAGNSMLPTIPTPCYTVGRVLRSGAMSKVEKGDVVSAAVVISKHGLAVRVCKRVHAVEGDRVTFNGRAYTVPKGHCFLLGDNADHSMDSRKYGAVPLENIRSKRTYIFSQPVQLLFPPSWKKIA